MATVFLVAVAMKPILEEAEFLILAMWFFFLSRRDGAVHLKKSVKTALDKVDKAIFDLDFLMLSGF